jgi:hypothetical protein
LNNTLFVYSAWIDPATDISIFEDVSFILVPHYAFAHSSSGCSLSLIYILITIKHINKATLEYVVEESLILTTSKEERREQKKSYLITHPPSGNQFLSLL